MERIQALLSAILDMLKPAFLAIAAHLTTKARLEAADAKANLDAVQRAKQVADGLSDADVKRLRNKWQR